MSMTRLEKDSLGEIEVPSDKYWGAQTQRSLKYFSIGQERMPIEVIHVYGAIKRAAAYVNKGLGLLSEAKMDTIAQAAQEVEDGKLDEHFPLFVWQTGSGTQTNMNVNEVIANRAIEIMGGTLGSKNPIHPNDDVNMGQSSNDTFPTAMYIAALKKLWQVHFTVRDLKILLEEKSQEYKDIIRVGRTHLQDAVPISLGQQFLGYAAQLAQCLEFMNQARKALLTLPIGGTAVGTGINTDANFGKYMRIQLSGIFGLETSTLGFNKSKTGDTFANIAAHESIVFTSSTLKTLACALTKIAKHHNSALPHRRRPKGA